ncbi:hypothetical protein ACFX12_044277 [Malus domestica]
MGQMHLMGSSVGLNDDTMAGREVQSSLGGLRDKEEPCHADENSRHWSVIREEVREAECGEKAINEQGLSFKLGGSAL